MTLFTSATVLLVASCAADPEASAPTATAGTSLTVTITAGADARDWTVTCDPAGGTHPRPESACDFLELARRWGQDPFAPVPGDAVCSQQYGGPQVATVRGTWRGRPVDATFKRTDGCEISRWDNAVPLLAVSPDLDRSASEPAKG